MSTRLRTFSSGLYLNSTKEDGESRDIVNACQVFNISMLALSVCVLAVTAVTCCVSYLNRWRHWKQVCKYESTVAYDLEEEPVKLKVMQRSHSLRKPLPRFQPSESFRKDDSSIYYIYTNPLPVGRHDEDSAVYQDGIVLDPPTFYMQLENAECNKVSNAEGK